MNKTFLFFYSHRPDRAKYEFQYIIEIGLFPHIFMLCTRGSGNNLQHSACYKCICFSLLSMVTYK